MGDRARCVRETQWVREASWRHLGFVGVRELSPGLGHVMRAQCSWGEAETEERAFVQARQGSLCKGVEGL